MIDALVLSCRRSLGRIDNNASVPFAILFVCTGNVCRSPMAELLCRAGAHPQADLELASAGMFALVSAVSSCVAPSWVAVVHAERDVHTPVANFSGETFFDFAGKPA